MEYEISERVSALRARFRIVKEYYEHVNDYPPEGLRDFYANAAFALIRAKASLDSFERDYPHAETVTGYWREKVAHYLHWANVEEPALGAAMGNINNDAQTTTRNYAGVAVL